MSELIPFKEFAKRYPWPTETALRGWYQRIGKDHPEVFYKCGKRLLIDPQAFFSMIKQKEIK